MQKVSLFALFNEGKFAQVVDILSAKNSEITFNVNEVNDRGESIMVASVKANRTEIAIALINANANFWDQDPSQQWAMELAVGLNRNKIFKAMMNKLTKCYSPAWVATVVNQPLILGYTLLTTAANNCNRTNAKLLLEGGADPLQIDQLFGTPLSHAGEHASADIVSDMLAVLPKNADKKLLCVARKVTRDHKVRALIDRKL